MTRKKAITVLRAHKQKLASIAAYDYDHLYLWQREALTYVGNLLGAERESYKLIHSFQFPTVQEANYDQTVSTQKSRLDECIDQAIEAVKNLGVLQKNYRNFFCRYTDKELLTYAITTAGGIFTAGIFVGRWLAMHLQ